jgi:peptide/nickel transport system ATP-binding protein
MTAPGEPTAPMLRVRDLRTQIATRQGVLNAIDRVSFDLDVGQTVGVVGESGSGKTVTALSVMRLIERPGITVHGSVFLGDVDVLKLSEPEMRAIRGKAVSMVFQEPMTSLNPVLTIGAQVSEAIRLHETVAQSEASTRSLEILRAVGISDPKRRARQYPHEMSGGMRQRVMIAMALSTNPQVLIADEPTTALDVTIQAEILSVFEDFRARTRLSILLITHDFGVIAEMADQVVVMYAGKVVEAGSVYRIFDAPHHPYTRGLLGSLPRIGLGRRRLDVIEGIVPDPLDLPQGCPFAPRCGSVMPVCREQEPPFQEVAPGHRSRCWLDAAGAKAADDAVAALP